MYQYSSTIATLWLSCFSQIPFVSSSQSQNYGRIINGKNADRDTYAQATVYIADREDNLVCGGALISPTLVITAAHCAGGILKHAVVGRYDRSDPTENYDTIPIIAERMHPDFDDVSLNNDLLLLQLERPSKLKVDYMLLNSIDGMPSEGMMLQVLGWGETSPDSDFSNGTAILQSVNVNYVSNEECNSIANDEEDYEGKILDTMLCTFKENADHCYGDSGGPVVVVAPNDPSRVMQVSVISWGAEKCADGVFPGVSQRISTSFDWIASWICAIDGTVDEDIDARYSCQQNQTFSPMPSPAPAVPTVSPAPTVFTVPLWIELVMDKWPGDISWKVVDQGTGKIFRRSPSYENSTKDEILEVVHLVPGRTYEFTIMDKFGDGLQGGGFVQVGLGGDDLATSTLMYKGNFEFELSRTFQTLEQTLEQTSARQESPTKTPEEQGKQPFVQESPTATPEEQDTQPFVQKSPTTTPEEEDTQPFVDPDEIIFTPTASPHEWQDFTPTKEECSANGESCTNAKTCCSNKCANGKCQKAKSPSPSRTLAEKVSVASGRDGDKQQVVGAVDAARGNRPLKKMIRGSSW